MNKVYDYNGTFVSPSKPVRELKTVKRTLLIDSRDRDVIKYLTNGDVVYYLPRVYENVICIRLKSATFPPLVATGNGGGAVSHPYKTGKNVPSTVFTSDQSVETTEKYFLIDIEGMNKYDETTVSAQRSTYPDSFFARIPAGLTELQITMGNTYFINYNDHTEEENITKYSPPIGKLDRMHIVTRTHGQQDRSGFIYWTVNGAPYGSGEGSQVADYSLVFEIEMLDNAFDDFSSFESRVSTRADTSNSIGMYGC